MAEVFGSIIGKLNAVDADGIPPWALLIIESMKGLLEEFKTISDLVKRIQVLKDGDNFTINWESKKLKLFIWDANKEDGDKITLIINGNTELLIMYIYAFG